uniref:Uncharacterized protein n=1 Tax=uncultured Caudovirales phage TaxID=2100421 RepID=A0A6J5L2I8_9CAUD|nr:hypothetical protein UFOVP114_74 [uncultured Caudovirales phage]
MSYKSKTLPMPSSDPFKVGREELGWDPDNQWTDFQITATGLGGGTYSVAGYVVGDGAEVARPLATGKGENDVVQLKDYLLRGLVFTLSGGTDPHPKFTITGRLHGI